MNPSSNPGSNPVWLRQWSRSSRRIRIYPDSIRSRTGSTPWPCDSFSRMRRNALLISSNIWKQDMVGRVLLERLLRVADRGVKVRMLLDDFGTVPSDPVLLAIDSHPNIEVRMFNPVTMRSLGIVADFRRANRRMHNKSFTADGQVSIVGGRNIAQRIFRGERRIQPRRSRYGGHRAGGPRGGRRV